MVTATPPAAAAEQWVRHRNVGRLVAGTSRIMGGVVLAEELLSALRGRSRPFRLSATIRLRTVLSRGREDGPHTGTS